MAKTAPVLPGYPIDQPSALSPATGVRQVEADFFGSDAVMAQPWTSPGNRAKGNLGLGTIAGLETRPLTSPGKPFKLS